MDELIQTAVEAIKERAANPHPPGHPLPDKGLATRYAMPTPGQTLDLAIAGLKAVDEVYLPALLQVLNTLRAITPG